MPTSNYDSTQGPKYKQYGQDNTYTMVSGRFALPVAEDPPSDPVALASWSPVVTVVAHAAYQIRTVDFAAVKDNAPPVVPSPQSVGACTFLTGNLHVTMPEVSSVVGHRRWRVNGQYVFVVDARSDPADGFVLGDTPIRTVVDDYIYQTYGAGTTPIYGAVAQAGPNAQMGYAESQLVSIGNPGSYTYLTPYFLPGTFLSSTMLNGSSA